MVRQAFDLFRQSPGMKTFERLDDAGVEDSPSALSSSCPIPTAV